MREWVSINGRLTPAEQASVSVFDSGFMQGIGLFETLRAYSGRVFRLEQHLQRLVNSAGKLGWAAIPTVEELMANVELVVGALEYSEARVRLTVTTGSLRAAAAADEPGLTIVASAAPGQPYAPELYKKGVTVAVSPFRQNPDDATTGHKVTSYYSRLAGLRAAHARGAFEALWFTPAGRLAEGSISNVFVVVDGELLTPPLETPVLPGVTRAVVIELAQRLKIAVSEEPLKLEDILQADEAFLTNCMMQIMPIARVEREPVGAEKPGEVTARLFDAYQQLIDAECGNG